MPLRFHAPTCSGRPSPWLLILPLLLMAAAWRPFALHGQDQTNQRINPQGIDGALVICGGGSLPKKIIDRFIGLAGGEQARLVIIPTASSRADQEDTAPLLESWQQHKPASLTLLHTRSRERANDPQFVKPLSNATGVWFSGGAQSRITAAYLGTAVEKELAALLKRGGVIGGSSAGAAVQSRLMIARGRDIAELQVGFDLLPGTIIDQHFLARKRQPRLIGAVARHPRLVGLGIDEGTALVVEGRQIEVLGRSSVTVCLAASGKLPAQQRQVPAGKRLDLTALRRTARDRQQPPFPAKQLAPTKLDAGALVIVGGGDIPLSIHKQFIRLAGGPTAPIVLISTARVNPLAKQVAEKEFALAGARNLKVLGVRNSAEAGSPQTRQLLERAGGIWFIGGRQWRLVDAFEETTALPLMHQLLQRGGVIGGTSAGASIQAEYLVRGNPLDRHEVMAAGYERGFAFLPGVAIDQHFTQRKRFADLTAVCRRYPQLLGIGIDESTALLVEGSKGLVMGEGQVHFYDRRRPLAAGKPDHDSYPAKTQYDLVERQVIFLPEVSKPATDNK